MKIWSKFSRNPNGAIVEGSVTDTFKRGPFSASEVHAILNNKPLNIDTHDASDTLLEVELKKEIDVTDLIKQIHDDFKTSGFKKFIETTKELEIENNKDHSEGKRLYDLGFISTEKANEYNRSNSIKRGLQSEIDTYNKIKGMFPFNNIIAQYDAQELCKKYKLVLGGISLFKGNVPEKNLKEIEDFIKNNKMPTVFRMDGWEHGWSTVNPTINYELEDNVKITNNSDGSIQLTINTRYNIRTHKVMLNTTDGELSYDMTSGDRTFSFKKETYKPKFSICAPVADMDTSGHIITDDYKLVPKNFDPVVLCNIPGDLGFVVVTAWGAEANDGRVINPLKN